MSKLVDRLREIPLDLWTLPLDEGNVDKPLREEWYTSQSDNGNDGWKPVPNMVRTFKGNKAFNSKNGEYTWVVRRNLHDQASIKREGTLFRREYQDHIYWTSYSVQLWLPQENRWNIEEGANSASVFKSGPQKLFEYLEEGFRNRAELLQRQQADAVKEYRRNARKKL